jgi:hypothetical protein
VAIGRQPDEHGKELSFEQLFDLWPSGNVRFEPCVVAGNRSPPELSLGDVWGICKASLALGSRGIDCAVFRNPQLGNSIVQGHRTSYVG